MNLSKTKFNLKKEDIIYKYDKSKTHPDITNLSEIKTNL